MDSLPNETLADIFLIGASLPAEKLDMQLRRRLEKLVPTDAVYSESNIEPFAKLVSTVCRRWQDIACSHPKLSYLTVQIGERLMMLRENHGSRWMLDYHSAQLAIDRHPSIGIFAGICGCDRCVVEEILPCLFDFLSKNSSRIRGLHFRMGSNASQTILPWFSYGSFPLPLLEAFLCFGLDIQGEETTVLDSPFGGACQDVAPNLRSLQLFTVPFHTIGILQNLEVLHLQLQNRTPHYAVIEIFSILESAPNLRECRVDFERLDPWLANSLSNRKPLKLAHLKTLSLDCYTVPLMNMLPYLILPALQRLVIAQNPSLDDGSVDAYSKSCGDIKPVFPTLEHLSISTFNNWVAHFLSQSGFPALRYANLDCGGVVENEIAPQWMHEERPICLPNLHSLDLKCSLLRAAYFLRCVRFPGCASSPLNEVSIDCDAITAGQPSLLIDVDSSLFACVRTLNFCLNDRFPAMNHRHMAIFHELSGVLPSLDTLHWYFTSSAMDGTAFKEMLPFQDTPHLPLCMPNLRHLKLEWFSRHHEPGLEDFAPLIQYLQFRKEQSHPIAVLTIKLRGKVLEDLTSVLLSTESVETVVPL